ncbi:hypothetical protein [Ruminococcus flavefaciens]|uniref:hypothetical protein n=1 Tax=Ruminococcus flavefaciens TaxID=1265 RepID=UPI0026EF8C31|nr:hypothetical protein [Ruminococcus flavefaciens]
MNNKTTYMLIKELSSIEQRKHLMSDEEFDALSDAEQEEEIRRATDTLGSDRALIHHARGMSDLPKEKSSDINIMKITAFSMIAGFAIICSVFFFYESNEELAGLMVAIGLILAAGVPAVCYIADKLKIEKTYGQTKEYADTNRSEGTPSKAVMWTGGIGVALAAASLVATSVLHGNVLGITFGALFFTGFTLLSISCKHNKKRDMAIFLNLPALLGLFMLIAHLTFTLKPELGSDIFTKLTAVYAAVIVLMPLIYNIIKLLRCRVKVEACCVEVKVTYSKYHRHPTYDPCWAYSFNDRDYLHWGPMTGREIVLDETRMIRINPKDPHDVHLKLLPYSCAVMMLISTIAAMAAYNAAVC